LLFFFNERFSSATRTCSSLSFVAISCLSQYFV